MKINKSKINNLMWLISISLLIVFHFNHPLNNDEGVALEGALNVLRQQEIYTDFFEFVTPGVFFVIAWLWKIFGVHYFVAKALAIISLLLSAWGISKISKYIFKNNLDALGPLLLILASSAWPIIIYHTFNILCAIWAVYFMIRSLDSQKYKYIAYSAILSGISVLFMQNKGLLLIAALGSFLLILSIKDRENFKKTVIYGLISLLPISILFIKWSPIFLYQKLILFPIQNYLGLPNISYFLLAIFIVWSLAIFFPFLKNKNKKIYFLFYIQIILFASTISLPDVFHITLILFPSYALLWPSISQSAKYIWTKKTMLYSVIAIGLIVHLLVVASWAKNFDLFFMDNKNNQTLKYITENCSDSEYIYAGPFLSSIYFETKIKNSTPFSWLITNHHSLEQFELAAEKIKQNQPLCAILNYKLVEKFEYQIDNPLDNYIKNNYKLEKKINNTLIYKINELPTPKQK